MAGLTAASSAPERKRSGLGAGLRRFHLRISDLPSLTARDEMEAADILIKSVDWNPAASAHRRNAKSRLVRATGGS